MNIISARAETVSVLKLEGSFDSHQGQSAREWIEAQTSGPPARLVINMAGVNFIDSSALAILVQGMKRARQHDGDLYLCEMQQDVRMVFELTRLHTAFAIFASEAEAIQAHSD